MSTGSGGNFTYIRYELSDRMVCQQLPMSCVAACVRQLLRDENIEVPEAEIRANSNYSDESGTELDTSVDFLNLYHPTKRFLAAAPVIGDLTTEQTVRLLTQMTGSWIARLKPSGKIAHAVIVDEITEDTVYVRDPWGDGLFGGKGAVGEMHLQEFIRLWVQGYNQAIYGFNK